MWQLTSLQVDNVLVVIMSFTVIIIIVYIRVHTVNIVRYVYRRICELNARDVRLQCSFVPYCCFCIHNVNLSVHQVYIYHVCNCNE